MDSSQFTLITTPLITRKNEDYDERESKPCTVCMIRKGFVKTGFAVVMNAGLVYLPKYIKCKRCDGYGYEHTTIDEQNFYDECRRDDERDR